MVVIGQSVCKVYGTRPRSDAFWQISAEIESILKKFTMIIITFRTTSWRLLDNVSPTSLVRLIMQSLHCNA